MTGSTTGQKLIARDSISIRDVPGYILGTTSMIADAHSRLNTRQQRLAAIVYLTYTIVDAFSKARGSEGTDLVARRLAGEAPEPVGIHADLPDDPDESTDEFDDAALEGILAQFNNLPTGGGFGSSSSSSSARGADNDRMLDLLCAGLAADPTSTITRDQAQLALDRMRDTPFDRLPPSTQALAGLLQEGGADLGRTGLVGAMGGLHSAMANLTPEEQAEVLATDDLSQLLEILKRTGARRY